jgi:hypothetical protein
MGLSTRIAKHIRSNVVGYVAVFLALTGTAAALPGTNSVDSGDIINGQVKTGDVAVQAVTRGRLAPDSVTGGKVADGSVSGVDVADGSLGSADVADQSLTGDDIGPNALTGTEINESQLGQVPEAALGGIGRSAGDPQDFCDPESSLLIICTSVNVVLPAQSRVLVIGQIRARDEVGADSAHGSCELGTSAVDLPSTSTNVETGRDGSFDYESDNVTLVGVTPPLGPGTVQFRIRCNQLAPGAIDYRESEIAAVALSPS